MANNKFISCLVVVVFPFLAILIHPCSKFNIIGDLSYCKELKDFGGCAVSPFLSWFFCGKHCGFCPAKYDKSKNLNKTWSPIPRMKAETLSYEDFVENYKKPGIPVIIEGWLSNHHEGQKMLSWNLNKLSKKCGKTPVHCTQRRVHAITMLINIFNQSPLLRKCIDYYLTLRFGTTCEKELFHAKTNMNLNDFIDNIQSKKVLGVDFRSLLDYMASALTVNDFPVDELCDEMVDDLLLPKWAMKETLLFSNDNEDKRLKPTLFIEADGARAYPAHQHGHDTSHGFQVLLQGQKKVVFWPYSERDNLYKTSVTTEHQEEIYLAEGIHHRFDLFPSMKHTNAWEGILNTGELLYVPCMGIHVFESYNGSSLGIRFSHQDKYSIKCAEDLVSENSTTIQYDYLKYMKTLKSISIPTTNNINEKNKIPKSVKELKNEMKLFRNDEKRRNVNNNVNDRTIHEKRKLYSSQYEIDDAIHKNKQQKEIRQEIKNKINKSEKENKENKGSHIGHINGKVRKKEKNIDQNHLKSDRKQLPKKPLNSGEFVRV